MSNVNNSLAVAFRRGQTMGECRFDLLITLFIGGVIMLAVLVLLSFCHTRTEDESDTGSTERQPTASVVIPGQPGRVLGPGSELVN
jgi:hypothetical protein